MPTSKSSSQGPGPDQRPPAITMDAELAGRLVAALEQLGVAVAPDRSRDRGGDERLLYGGTVDPVRARASRDYEVLRGLLGRADAPTPLRMLRQRPGGGSREAERGGGELDVVDNEIVVLDPVPLSACLAIVESPGDGSTSPLTEEVSIDPRELQPTLALTEISANLPISRVEIVDKNKKLVAFGPAFEPLPQPQYPPYYQPSGGR
jgi:hypothetical protein